MAPQLCSDANFQNLTSDRLEEEARIRLSDFKNFDVSFLEFVVSQMKDANDSKIKNASLKILQQIKEQKDCWKVVQPVLDTSTHQDTVYFALLLLEHMVQKNWRALSLDDRVSMNSFVKELIQKLLDPSSAEISSQSQHVLKKLNSIIVEIAKKEYPLNWPTFIQELTDIQQFQNENALSILTNNLRIIRFFANDILKFSTGKIQHNRLMNIKENLIRDFESSIFHLIHQTIKNLFSKEVFHEAFGCLEAFAESVDVKIFFEENFLKATTKYISNCTFSSILLNFLACIVQPNSDINSDNVILIEHQTRIKQLLICVLDSISNILPLDIDLKNLYSNMSDDEQDFLISLALFFNKLFRNNKFLFTLHEDDLKEAIKLALNYMIKICHIKGGYYFQYHSAFWKDFTELVKSDKSYENIIKEFLLGFCMSMAKPEEILICQDDAGNIVREELKDTQQILKFNEMQKCLENLLISDFRSLVLETIFELLTKQTGTWFPEISLDNPVPSEGSLMPRHRNNTDWTYNSISSISYAIGCCSGVITVDEESQFAVLVLKELLFMNEHLSKPEQKSVIATCIMYIIGQYPRFLRDNEKFCRTVILKLFEFMHEPFVGVKDMSCDTFAKIVSKCKKMFCKPSFYEQPFLIDIASQIPQIIEDLSNHQKLSFFKSLAVLCAEYNTHQHNFDGYFLDPFETIIRYPYLEDIQNFVDVISSGNEDHLHSCYSNNLVLNKVSFSLNIIYTFYEIVVFPFELIELFISLLENLYIFSRNYNLVSQMEILPHLKHLKKETLNFVNSIFESCKNQHQFSKIVAVLESFLMIILHDYSRNTDENRDSSILNVVHTFLDSKESHKYIPTIIESCLVPTLQMIRINHKDYMDHRLQIFKIVRCLVKNHFESLLAINETDFRLIIDTIIYALTHMLTNILDLGLEILKLLLQNIVYDVARAQVFYRHFVLLILQHLLLLITDSAFRNSLQSHAEIFCLLIHKIESGFIFVPIDPQAHDSDDSSLATLIKQNIDKFPNHLQKHQNNNSSTIPRSISSHITDANVKFLFRSLLLFITQNYGHLSQNDLQTFVIGLFAFDSSPKKMLYHIQDFLIEVTENRSDDFVDPYNQIRIKEMLDEQLKKNNNLFPDFSTLLQVSTSLSDTN